MILLPGGTGVLGTAIAVRLLQSGRAVRVLTRDPSRASALAAQGALIVNGDLMDPGSLDRAMGGITHVVTTANAFTAPARGAVERLDVQGNRNLIDAAVRAGVRQFVFTSVWLPDAVLVRPFTQVFARQVQAGALMATVPQAFDAAPSRARWNVPMTRLEDWARARYDIRSATAGRQAPESGA